MQQSFEELRTIYFPTGRGKNRFLCADEIKEYDPKFTCEVLIFCTSAFYFICMYVFILFCLTALNFQALQLRFITVFWETLAFSSVLSSCKHC